MKYVDEYRDSELIKSVVGKIKSLSKNNWSIMEVCGGQTHTILRYGIEDLLPPNISLLHGPGCPVCVTPIEVIDKAIQIASTKDVILASFGDMLRVPGSKSDLLNVKANGGDVRILYSPLDTIKLAEQNLDKKVVFFAVGFETTAPSIAMIISEAEKRGLNNLSVLCSHVLVPPAIELILSSSDSNVNAFLAAGHVCTIMGYEEYIPLAEKYTTPIIVTGFEPLDILHGVYFAVKQLEEKRYEVENQYSRSVRKEGNTSAKQLLERIFEVCDQKWRGIGTIPNSGLKLKDEFAKFNADLIFDLKEYSHEESKLCIAGLVLQGVKKPMQCSAFGLQCTPEHPLGAPMVSSEGACAAYYLYKKN